MVFIKNQQVITMLSRVLEANEDLRTVCGKMTTVPCKQAVLHRYPSSLIIIVNPDR